MRLTELADQYHEQLDDHAIGFFEDLGITPRTLEEFNLGWVREPLLAQHEVVADQPVFPYTTVRGKVIALRFNAFVHDMMGEQHRTIIGTDFPLSVPEHHLYNVRHALPGLRSSQVILTSDVRSVLVARQVGWRAVAAPGYGRWYEPWNHLFDEAHVVLVWSESEDAQAEAVARQLKRRGVDILPLRLPDGDSLASLLGPDVPRGSDLLEVVSSLPIQIVEAPLE